MNGERGGLAIALIIVVAAVIILFGIWSLRSRHVPSFAIHTLEVTKGFVARHSQKEDSGTFTVSPDGRFILYAVDTKNDGIPIEDSLALLDLSTGAVKTLTAVLGDGRGLGSFTNYLLGERGCWKPDSSACVLPSPGATDYKIPAYVVDLTYPNHPQYVEQVPYHSADSSTLTYAQLGISGKLTCSDCEANVGTVDRYKATLPTFGRNAHIGQIAVAPSGQWIAYQVSYGQGYISPPGLYVFSTAWKKSSFVASNVYYQVQWAPDSHRLYFYMCKIGGVCGDGDAYIRYIEV
jgi:hypothetical protein